MNFPITTMPDLSGGTHAFQHDVNSALATLLDGGVPASRITIRMAGFGNPAGQIVAQAPATGMAISEGTKITLFVAGASYFSALPVAMWDRGDESGPGTAELLEPIDDPLQKAASWLHEGARLLDVRPDSMEDCARWIGLFGLKAEGWPTELWYRLAILLPNLQALAGTEHGIRFGLEWLLELPVAAVSLSPQRLYIEGGLYSRLGTEATHLGMDAVAGPYTGNAAALDLTLGPVKLATFEMYRRPEKAELLEAVLDLLAAFDQVARQTVRLRWRVEDAQRAPTLGMPEMNSILGVNCHLGTEAARRAAA